MSEKLRILMLEDVPSDAELTGRALRKAGLDGLTRRVETRAEFCRELEEFAPDVILSDFSLPDFDGLSALAVAREKCPKTPFIFVSGAIGEETAVAAIKQGAADYLLKDRLARLGPAVLQALEKRRLDEEKNRAQQALAESEAFNRVVLSSLSSHVAVLNEQGIIIAVNQAWERFARERLETAAVFVGIGADYLAVCLRRSAADNDFARAGRAGIRKVLAGEQSLFILEYPWPTAQERRWFVMGVTPLIGGRRGVVVAHTDITERKLAEEKIRAYTIRLERSNRELRDFAFVASHDLQEPLRKIRTLGDRLRSRFQDRLGEIGLDYLARMQAAAARMQQMINDLLALSRVENRTLAYQQVALRKIALQVMAGLEPQIAASGARIELGELPELEADPVQIRELLQDLLANALKFHKPGQTPLVRIYGEHCTEADADRQGIAWERVRLVVEDDGIGFDEKYREQIFTAFQRLHKRDEYPGTGIGLAICRRIVERHGGRITAHGAPDQGARFTVILPAQRPAEEAV